MFFYGVDATKKPTAAPLGADNTYRSPFLCPQEESDLRAFFRMSRSAFSLVTFFTQSRNCDTCTLRSCDACTYDTPRSLIRRTASSLNSRVNFRLSMTHLQLHQNT